MLRWRSKIPCEAAKAWCSQINKYPSINKIESTSNTAQQSGYSSFTESIHLVIWSQIQLKTHPVLSESSHVNLASEVCGRKGKPPTLVFPWCFSGTLYRSCSAEFVSVARCRQSPWEQAEVSSTFLSCCWPDSLVPSGNWICDCLMLPKAFGSFSEMVHFLSLFISQREKPPEMTKVFFQPFDLYNSVKSTQLRCALRRPGASTEVVCVPWDALFL